MLTDLVMVTGPKSPGSSTSISPPASVCASAAAKVRHGDARVHGLESLPDVAETQVRLFAGSPPVVKAADTLSAALIVTEQPPLPLQAPLQPMKLMPGAGVAVSVTGVPLLKLALHVDGQLMPAGLLCHRPAAGQAHRQRVDYLRKCRGHRLRGIHRHTAGPGAAAGAAPAVELPAACRCGGETNLRARSKISAAARRTADARGRARHRAAAGDATDSATPCTNVADTDCGEFIVTVQPALPLQAPPQPLKIQPLAGVAVKVTGVPLANPALQVDGQLMPEDCSSPCRCRSR